MANLSIFGKGNQTGHVQTALKSQQLPDGTIIHFFEEYVKVITPEGILQEQVAIQFVCSSCGVRSVIPGHSGALVNGRPICARCSGLISGTIRQIGSFFLKPVE